MANVKSPETEFTIYLVGEGVILSSSEEQFLVPILLKFRKEHRRWEREGRPQNGRGKIDRTNQELNDLISDYERRAMLINFVLLWQG